MKYMHASIAHSISVITIRITQPTNFFISMKAIIIAIMARMYCSNFVVGLKVEY